MDLDFLTPSDGAAVEPTDAPDIPPPPYVGGEWEREDEREEEEMKEEEEEEVREEEEERDVEREEEEFQSTPKRQRLDVNDDEALLCPICMQSCSNSGVHRLACLACGHLFGKSCVEKWLREKKKCPSCNMFSVKSHIRVLYVTHVKALDTAELEFARGQLQSERDARRRSDERCVGLQTNYDAMRRELGAMEREMERLRAVPRTPYVLLDTLVLSQGRVCDVCDGVLCVSCRLDGGFGLLKTTLDRLSEARPVPRLHSRPIRDVAISAGGLVLTASGDGTVRALSLATDGAVATFALGGQVWACAWDPEDPAIAYASAQCGGVAVLDMRAGGTPQAVMPHPAGSGPPVHSIARVGAGRRLVAGSARGVCVWESPADGGREAEWASGVQCTSLVWDASGDRGLASLRPSRLTLFDAACERVGDMPSPPPNALMSRAALFGGCSAAVGDGCVVRLWNGDACVGRQLPAFHTDPVLQARHVVWRDTDCIISLSERQLIVQAAFAK